MGLSVVSISVAVLICALSVTDIESAPQQIDFGDLSGQLGNFQNQTAVLPGMTAEGYRPVEGMQNQTGTMPGMSVGTGYYEQLQNQTYTLPTAPNVDEFTNATLPTGSGYVDRFQDQTGTINNQTSQYQGCMPGTRNGDKEKKKN